MSKKNSPVEAAIREASALRIEEASVKKRLTDCLAVIKKAYAGKYVKGEEHGDTLLETRRNRTLNKERAFRLYGKKATERVVTPAAVARLGLSEADLDALYDEGEPAIYLSPNPGFGA